MIDAHVHIEGEKYPPLSSWISDSHALGVEAAVLVQSLGSVNNAPLLDAVHSDVSRFAAIVIPEAPADTAALLAEGAVGVRIGADGLHAYPGDRVALEALAERRGIASVHDDVSAIVDPAFRQLVVDFPDVVFRLEHVACLPHSAGAVIRNAVIRLGELPNVHVVWSGFFHFSDHEMPYADAWPALRDTLNVFTSDRITWSGDWNRAGGNRASYRRELDLLDALPFVTSEIQQDIAFRTARRTYWKDSS